MASENYSLLRTINSPADLKKLSIEQLVELSRELREFLINTVSKTSGHFASGLGVVELTIAIHYVFDAPNDQIIWDVGHQAYPHKMIFIPSVRRTDCILFCGVLKVNMMFSQPAMPVPPLVRHWDLQLPTDC